MQAFEKKLETQKRHTSDATPNHVADVRMSPIYLLSMLTPALKHSDSLSFLFYTKLGNAWLDITF